MIRYDAVGRQVAMHRLRVPIAFSAGTLSESGGQLWGARRLNELAIVRYKWRWIRPESSTLDEEEK